MGRRRRSDAMVQTVITTVPRAWPAPTWLDGRGRLTQRIGAVDDRRDRARGDELAQGGQVLTVLELDRGSRLLMVDQRRHGRLDDRGHPAARVPSAVREQCPPRCQCTPGVRQRVVPDVVQDEVVARPSLGEVLAGVVDDVVGTDGPDHVHVLRAAHAGDLGAERLGDLDGERSDAARGAVDQDLLPGLDLALVAQELQGGRGRHADGRRLLEGEVGRLLDEMVLRWRERTRRRRRRTSRTRRRRRAGS